MRWRHICRQTPVLYTSITNWAIDEVIVISSRMNPSFKGKRLENVSVRVQLGDSGTNFWPSGFRRQQRGKERKKAAATHQFSKGDVLQCQKFGQPCQNNDKKKNYGTPPHWESRNLSPTTLHDERPKYRNWFLREYLLMRCHTLHITNPFHVAFEKSDFLPPILLTKDGGGGPALSLSLSLSLRKRRKERVWAKGWKSLSLAHSSLLLLCRKISLTRALLGPTPRAAAAQLGHNWQQQKPLSSCVSALSTLIGKGEEEEEEEKECLQRGLSLLSATAAACRPLLTTTASADFAERRERVRGKRSDLCKLLEKRWWSRVTKTKVRHHCLKVVSYILSFHPIRVTIKVQNLAYCASGHTYNTKLGRWRLLSSFFCIIISVVDLSSKVAWNMTPMRSNLLWW
jgi:hypothetical protein